MKKTLLILWILSVAFCCRADAAVFPVEEVEELLAKDNETRLRWIRSDDPIEKQEIAQAIRLQEIKQTKRIKQILGYSGLPTDEDSLSTLLTLAIRSSDLKFQETLLARVTKLHSTKQHGSVPNLTDRILLRQGLPQHYGTHLYQRDASFMPYPIESIENVDLLREEFGDEPLHTYIQMTQKLHQIIQQEDWDNLLKWIFLLNYNIYDFEDTYLYSASFDQSNSAISMAYDHPVEATMAALAARNWNIQIKEDDTGNSFISISVSPSELTDLLDLLHTPIYMSLVTRDGLLTYDKVGEIVCDTIFEPITMSGKEIKLAVEGFGEYELPKMKPVIQQVVDTILVSLYFDITLENELFLYK